MRDLSKKQLKVLEFVRNFISEYGHSPTHREICKAMEITSVNGVKHHLDALVRKGCITINPKMARGIKLTAPYKEISGLPLVVEFSNDLPVTAMENVEGYYSLDVIFGDSGNLFLLRIKGDSMTGAGINDGDILVVEQGTESLDGKIGVVLVDEKTHVKRIYFQDGHIRLNPENPTFSPYKFDPEKKKIRKIGKVIGVVRKIKEE